ncbi:Conserved_hypothetical protein [Hexamita inflata]|uniref:Uncharacterized protein n=1 Tax=Hexamita inflata TaxID=28002 RepID=A0AA86PNV0_9EUKA|nr:Conserved hypothetical protein [Hexamita inflata]
MKQVNFVVFTQEIQNIIKAFQIPFCCLINEKQQIVYKGPTATQNYALIISRLNEIKKPKQLQEVVKIIQEPELKNNNLSLLLAGLSARHREGATRLLRHSEIVEEPRILFTSQYECPLIKSHESRSQSRQSSMKVHKVHNEVVELGEAQLPLLQQLEEKALPNNCMKNIYALKRVKILKKIKRPVQLQTVDEWTD